MTDHALLIPAALDAPARLVPFDPTAPDLLQTLQGWVSGYVEPIEAGPVVFLMCEDGIALQMPLNPRATQFLQTKGFLVNMLDGLRGDVIVIGSAGTEFTAVPANVVKEFEAHASETVHPQHGT